MSIGRVSALRHVDGRPSYDGPLALSSPFAEDDQRLSAAVSCGQLFLSGVEYGVVESGSPSAGHLWPQARKIPLAHFKSSEAIHHLVHGRSEIGRQYDAIGQSKPGRPVARVEARPSRSLDVAVVLLEERRLAATEIEDKASASGRSFLRRRTWFLAHSILEHLEVLLGEVRNQLTTGLAHSEGDVLPG